MNFPGIPCYHMRHDDAWDLPYPYFRDLSDIQRKIIEKERSRR